MDPHANQFTWEMAFKVAGAVVPLVMLFMAFMGLILRWMWAKQNEQAEKITELKLRVQKAEFRASSVEATMNERSQRVNGKLHDGESRFQEIEEKIDHMVKEIQKTTLSCTLLDKQIQGFEEKLSTTQQILTTKFDGVVKLIDQNVKAISEKIDKLYSIEGLFVKNK